MEQDETMLSGGTICPLSLRSGARSQGWDEGEFQAPSSKAVVTEA
ncbi:hypothetical protein J2T49_001720 [Pseudomonas nitroreducens]|nr:hypothetical protein [Pseudomonas nitroreducens]MCP1685781.1 hypothetical protein [Pseudomonas nitroreducens]